MLADLSRVAETLREDTFAAALTRAREVIQRQLRESGTYTIREGGREFTITVRADCPRTAPSVECAPAERSQR